jgi:hypothetical protein
VPRRGLLQVRSRRYACNTVARMEEAGAVRRTAAPRELCQEAWRRQALPAGGLHLVSSWRRHAELYRAWRGQALPRGGLHQVYCCLRGTSDDLTVLYSNGPDDRSVKMVLGYVTAATYKRLLALTPGIALERGRKRHRDTASPTGVAGAASTRAALSQLLQSARSTASRMAAAGAASKRAAPRTPHCQAHRGGKRCQHAGCTKKVARAPGSVYCTLCLQREQPDDA